MKDFVDRMFFAGGLAFAAVIVAATMLYRPAAGYTLLHLSLVALILTAFAARYFGAGIGGLVGIVATIAIAVAIQGLDMTDTSSGGLQFSAAILALVVLGAAGFIAYLGRATEHARSAERDAAAAAHLGVGFVPQRFDEKTVGEFLIAIAAMTGAREVRAAVERDGEVSLIPVHDDLGPEWADRRKVAGLVLEGARTASTDAGIREAGLITSLADVYIPIASRSGVDGVLIAAPPGERGAWTESETGTLRFAAELLGALIERERFHSQALRLEAMREAETLKASILLSVSHDVKTPLAAANATVSKLLDEARGRGDERQAEDLAETVDDLQTLNSRINELIDLSRLETASWKSYIDWNDAHDLFNLATRECRASEQCRVRSVVPADMPPFRFDIVQLARAVHHLVQNALLYSPEDEDVVVEVVAEDPDVRIHVTDSGPGLSEEDLEVIFEKFVRGSAGLTVSHGTGLGLAIASQIAQNHGGRIEAANTDEGGARFTIVLPHALEDPK